MVEGSPLAIRGLAFTSSSSWISGSRASLLGTGVKSLGNVTRLKFGLLPRALRGLERSGRFTTCVALGVLEKKECIDFWPAEELAFLRVAGVDAFGVDEFFAMTIYKQRPTENSDVCIQEQQRKGDI